MLSLRKIGMWGLGMGMLIALAGCQSSGSAKGGSVAAGGEPKAVACTKCKITYVEVPTSGQGKYPVHKFTTSQSMECPDCKDAVANFFATGKLEHTCKHCGETLEVCTNH
jgi:hypothetical protein